MYYKLSDFYKRDTSFVFDEEKNYPIGYFDLMSGKAIKVVTTLIYTVDKIDTYLDKYDILPTIGAPLVSRKFREVFNESVDLEYYPVQIQDKKGNTNDNFLCLNILNVIPCVDKEKSVFEIDEDGDYEIKKLYIQQDALGVHSIVRMKEHTSYIIVTETFKQIVEKAKMKGFNFIEEGNSIYTDI